jgi:hypothetical protein
MFLVDWYRTQLATRSESYCQNVEVDRVEPPAASMPDRLLVVRFDGRTRTSQVTAEASVGLSMLAGTKAAPKDAMDLGLMVLALSERLPSGEASNPVAAVLSSTGPVQVEEDADRGRTYVTLDLAEVGLPF